MAIVFRCGIATTRKGLGIGTPRHTNEAHSKIVLGLGVGYQVMGHLDVSLYNTKHLNHNFARLLQSSSTLDTSAD